MTIHAKITLHDSQRYPCNLLIKKNVEDIVVFLVLNVFNFNNFFIFSAVEMLKSLM